MFSPAFFLGFQMHVTTPSASMCDLLTPAPSLVLYPLRPMPAGATNTGDFIAPGKQKVHNQLYGQFYGWLHKYTKGRLTREDVPPGSLKYERCVCVCVCMCVYETMLPLKTPVLT